MAKNVSSKCVSETAYGRCGKCVGCVINKRNAWMLRLLLEAQMYDSDCVQFLTMTYDDEHLPVDVESATRSLQLYIKRLRKVFDSVDIKLRYFAALERGERFGRYHWHVILYGIRYTYDNRQLIDKAWQQGYTRIEPAHVGSYVYVLKYVVKDRLKVLASRKPGLGHGMIDPIIQTVNKLSNDEIGRLRGGGIRCYLYNNMSESLGVIRVGGYTYPLHRYLKDRLRKPVFRIDLDQVDTIVQLARADVRECYHA